MSEMYHYVLAKPSRLLYSSIVEKSAPRNMPNIVPKFSATFGIEEEDFKNIVDLMVQAIKKETGDFTAPDNYYLACQSSKNAARRALMKAQLDAQGKTPEEAFKIMEKAETRGALYAPYAAILTAASQYPVSLARLDAGKIVDIGTDETVLAQAGKDYFYPGAYVAPAIKLKGFRRKTLDAKDGVTAYLQKVLFVRKGERISGGSPDSGSVFKNYSGYSDYDPTANAPSDTDLTHDI